MEVNKSVICPNISVIVPVYNEQESIPHLYSRLKKVLNSLVQSYEVIFINDGSTDHSMFEILKLTNEDDSVFYINFSRNFGHQIALSAGLENCTGEVVVIIDADLQDPPELIIDLYEKYKLGFDVVHARRRKRKGESLLKKITAKLFYRVLSKLTLFEISLDTGDFKLINKKVVTYLKNMPEQNKFLRGQIAWLGFKQTDVFFNRDSRKFGNSSYPWKKSIQLAIDGITSLSDKPLLWVSRIGFIISLLSFIVILFALFSHFILKETITGWTSLIISSMFIGGIQLLSIGIIGEYISRINKNVIKRPLYIVDETNIEQLND